MSQEYDWSTFLEVNQDVEALASSLRNKELCPLLQSDVGGTPDLSMLAIFSENRPEWFITTLASTSESICVVPIAVEQQFLSELRIQQILEST